MICTIHKLPASALNPFCSLPLLRVRITQFLASWHRGFSYTLTYISPHPACSARTHLPTYPFNNKQQQAYPHTARVPHKKKCSNPDQKMCQHNKTPHTHTEKPRARARVSRHLTVTSVYAYLLYIYIYIYIYLQI